MKARSKYCGCLYFAAAALGRVMGRIADEEFACTGLSPSHGFLLMSVNDKPGITPGELATVMHLTPSTVTRLIERMEAKGYVTRKEEGRNTFVFPAEKSKSLDPVIRESWTNLHTRYSALIGQGKARELTEAIYEVAMKLSDET